MQLGLFCLWLCNPVTCIVIVICKLSKHNVKTVITFPAYFHHCVFLLPLKVEPCQYMITGVDADQKKI